MLDILLFYDIVLNANELHLQIRQGDYSIMWDVILDTVIDSVKLIPFLFLTYLVMEYLENKAADKMQNAVKKAGKLGPLFGGILGVVPQCGFSAAATSLYAGRVITLGTLIAIYLSTSDEMLPILISEKSIGTLTIIKILALKMVIGMIAGFLIDFFIRKSHHGAGEDKEEHIHELCEHDHCHCGKSSSIVGSAFIHTLKITGFILLVTFILNTALHMWGEENLRGLFLNKPVIGELIAGVVGLIPNCAASVVLTQLYVEGVLSFAACMSGLLVGAGVGVLVLFRTNRNVKENIKIVALLYGIGVVAGLLLELVPAGFFR